MILDGGPMVTVIKVYTRSGELGFMAWLLHEAVPTAPPFTVALLRERGPASTRDRHVLRSAFDGLPVLESEGAIFEAARRPRSLVTVSKGVRELWLSVARGQDLSLIHI